MVSKKDVVIVLSLLEGADFTLKKFVSHNFFVEAHFDGEAIVSDYFPLQANAGIDFEFAWEVSSGYFQQCVHNNKSIKVNFFASHKRFHSKHLIGYFYVDLGKSSKLNVPATLQWKNVLATKLSPNPKVLLSLSLQTPTPAPEKKLKARLSGVDISRRQTNQGYYLIGKTETVTHDIAFSVMIAYACNLDKLDISESSDSSSFRFYYSLFDNDVYSEEFYSLKAPEFNAERCALRIRSSEAALKAYFLSLEPPVFRIHLLKGTQTFGSLAIPYQKLFSKKSTKSSNTYSFDLEANFLLNQGIVDLPTPRKDLSDLYNLPFLGVSLCLQFSSLTNITTHDSNAVSNNSPIADSYFQKHKPNSLVDGYAEKQNKNTCYADVLNYFILPLVQEEVKSWKEMELGKNKKILQKTQKELVTCLVEECKSVYQMQEDEYESKVKVLDQLGDDLKKLISTARERIRDLKKGEEKRINIVDERIKSLEQENALLKKKLLSLQEAKKERGLSKKNEHTLMNEEIELSRENLTSLSLDISLYPKTQRSAFPESRGRLISNRKILLSSGLISQNDKIIKHIDEEINCS